MQTYAFQAIGIYKKTDKASALKLRDYKDATDLICNTIGGDAMTSVVRRLTPLE